MVIPLDRPESPEALESLLAAARDGTTGPVFRSRLGTPYTASGLRSILKRRDILPRHCRDTFAQGALDQGIMLEHLQRLMHHKDPAMTLRYAQVNDRIAAAAAKNVVSPMRRALALNLAEASETDQADHQRKTG